jgi:hypothetical protein
MRHAPAGHSYPPYQIGRRVGNRVESAINLCEKPSVDGPPEYLVVDSMSPQFGRSNDFALVRES